MSLGRVIAEMSASLEALKKMNALAPVPLFEQAAMEWACKELRDRFPGKFVCAICRVCIHSTDGEMAKDIKVYHEDYGHFEAPTFSLALAKLVQAVADKERSEDVLESATDDAMLKAVEPDKAATEEIPVAPPLGWDHF